MNGKADSRLWRTRCRMKVGILTFHSSYNFGANLQALAVQELLKKKGCQPVVIDYRDPWKDEMLRSRVLPAQAEMHERFIEKYLNTSPRFSCEKDVREYCNDQLDVIAVGSDQVFRLLSKWAPVQLFRQLLTGNPSSSWTQVTDRLPVYWLPWPKNGGRAPARVSIAACTTGTSFFYLGKTLRPILKGKLPYSEKLLVKAMWVVSFKSRQEWANCDKDINRFRRSMASYFRLVKTARLIYRVWQILKKLPTKFWQLFFGCRKVI